MARLDTPTRVAFNSQIKVELVLKTMSGKLHQLLAHPDSPLSGQGHALPPSQLPPPSEQSAPNLPRNPLLPPLKSHFLRLPDPSSILPQTQTTANTNASSNPAFPKRTHLRPASERDNLHNIRTWNPETQQLSSVMPFQAGLPLQCYPLLKISRESGPVEPPDWDGLKKVQVRNEAENKTVLKGEGMLSEEGYGEED